MNHVVGRLKTQALRQGLDTKRDTSLHWYTQGTMWKIMVGKKGHRLSHESIKKKEFETRSKYKGGFGGGARHHNGRTQKKKTGLPIFFDGGVDGVGT